MKVSVVIPTFNGEKFLHETIQSVIAQNYPDLELIISDDGSTDGTISIINKFNDPRILLFKKNGGQKGIFQNLNHGISKASGEYIQILCQDDVLANGFILNQIEIFKKHTDIGMVFSNVKILNEKSEIFDLDPQIYEFRNGYLDVFPKKYSLNYFAAYGCMPGNLSPVMLKKATHNNIGTFNINFPYAGDFEYWIRLGFEYDIAYNRNNYVLLRNHQGQASKSLIKKNYHLFKEIGQIYGMLIRNSFEGRREKEVVNHLNKLYGPLFLKTMLNQMLKINFKNFFEGFSYLNKYPFDIKFSIFFLLKGFVSNNKKIHLLKYLK